ncbi:hypothetical protein WA026_017632 [Henosepilachna vigintioctopunctata]|uniref:Uncharacterized protein n=1 Tax=Henosepilachna vigintioctopunctata TaxID=420089 RepID=A0AAW1V1Q9_9CUCU
MSQKILGEWKETSQGSWCCFIPKVTFPALLKKLSESMSTAQDNMKTGFRKSGIYHIDRNQVLERLPSYAMGPRRKKVNVPAEKSITVEEVIIGRVTTNENRNPVFSIPIARLAASKKNVDEVTSSHDMSSASVPFAKSDDSLT